VEQAHIVRAFRFELTKVQVPAIRRRMLANLANVDDELVSLVAAGLGMEVPEPSPRAMEPPRKQQDRSPPLSLLARPGEVGIRTRTVAILLAAGVDGQGAMAVHKALVEAGAVPRMLAARLGPVESTNGDPIEADATLETMPSCLFDAVVVPDGELAAQALSAQGQAVEFMKDQFRHCKAILALGAGRALVERAMIPLDGDDAALIVAAGAKGAAGAAKDFIAAIARHRNWDRWMDPPPV
jgi:catalase